MFYQKKLNELETTVKVLKKLWFLIDVLSRKWKCGC